MTPTETFWYLYYVSNGNEMDTQAKAKFRRQFRLPYKQFCQLLNLLEKDERVRWWGKGSCNNAGMTASPLSLLLLRVSCFLYVYLTPSYSTQ